MSILTLNVRRDKGDDGINNWKFRRSLVARILDRHRPDAAAFQEVLLNQLRDLESMLPGYDWVGAGRDDGAEAGEFAPVFYRGLTPGRSGTFWLSDTPDVRSRSWRGMTRICTWVDFAGPGAFSVYNTHLEYKSRSTQLKSVALLGERTADYPAGHPLLVVGDFNFNPGSRPHAGMAKLFRDSFAPDPTLPPAGKGAVPTTCHDFTGRTRSRPNRPSRIDYIWYRGAAGVDGYRILTDTAEAPVEVFPSDHWPVMCKLTLTGDSQHPGRKGKSSESK